MADVMTPELRAMAMQLLGQGALRSAGNQVNAPNRGAEIQAQELAAMQGQQPVPVQTPLGGPAQPSLGGPQDPSTFMPQGIPKQNGGRMTPEQAARLAEMLRARQ